MQLSYLVVMVICLASQLNSLRGNQQEPRNIRSRDDTQDNMDFECDIHVKGLPLTTTANLSWNLKQNQIDHEVVVFPLNLSDYSKLSFPTNGSTPCHEISRLNFNSSYIAAVCRTGVPMSHTYFTDDCNNCYVCFKTATRSSQGIDNINCDVRSFASSLSTRNRTSPLSTNIIESTSTGTGSSNSISTTGSLTTPNNATDKADFRNNESTATLAYLILILTLPAFCSPLIICCICKYYKRQLQKEKLKNLKPVEMCTREKNEYSRTVTNPEEGPNPEEKLEESKYDKNLRILRSSISKNLFIPSGTIQIMSVIGQGEFGIVFKGIMKKGHHHQLVAVKTIKGLASSAEDIKSMIDEIVKMDHFDHPNVMSLIGVCMDSSENGGGPSIVMPFMEKGSLFDFLRNNRTTLLIQEDDTVQVEAAQKTLIQMCWQVAKGMEYLASMKFLHRDLAARNCMIDVQDRVKIADFGLTEDIYLRKYYKQSTVIKMPVKWMAIESMKMGTYSEKTDVWSFGVTCWEVFSVGEIPYAGIHPHGIVDYLDTGGRLKKPKNSACNDMVYNLMLSCWETDSKLRPNFSNLARILESHLKETAEYLEMSRHLDTESSQS